MFKGMGQLFSLLKNARNMGDKMGEISETLKARRVTGQAGGELVVVEANGLSQILRVTIDPLLIEQGDFGVLQDLLPAAINDALTKAKQMHVEAVQSLTGGLELPGMGDLMKHFDPPLDDSSL
ncbi:MAG TPA: YbaB/EbfC family nucleoid-associated protein [Pirellulaceae bacterium]|nr:YbaB/EbfC family nucleoid-associated protein [Pirellulaceae bacterium]